MPFGTSTIVCLLAFWQEDASEARWLCKTEKPKLNLYVLYKFKNVLSLFGERFLDLIKLVLANFSRFVLYSGDDKTRA